jgi:hypothetical protein
MTVPHLKSLRSSVRPFYCQCLSVEIAWLCATGVAEIAESTNLKVCPHTLVYIMWFSNACVSHQ